MDGKRELIPGVSCHKNADYLNLSWNAEMCVLMSTLGGSNAGGG